MYKKVALALVVVYLFLSGFMVADMGGHAVHHGQTSHHADQHISFICAWMCSASSFIDSDVKMISKSYNVSSEKLIDRSENPVKLSSIFSFHIRPPPVSSPS
jgi:hypothetical protein